MKPSEADIESSIVIQLNRMGWKLDPREPARNVFRQKPRTKDEKNKLGLLRPDFILYADENSNQSTVVIEAKRPDVSMRDALEQSKDYARFLNTPIAIATDGYRLKTWSIRHNSPLFYNDCTCQIFLNSSASRF